MVKIVQLRHGFSAAVDSQNFKERTILFLRALMESGQKLQRKQRDRVLAKKRNGLLRYLRFRMLSVLKN